MVPLPKPLKTVATFDETAIREHVCLIHGVAAGIDGLIVVTVFHANPTGEKDAPGVITHHRVGDIDGTVDAVMAHAETPNANVYLLPAIMRPDLPRGKKGTEGDVVAVLALVADYDDDTGKTGEMPVEPNYSIESSPGNFQHFVVLDRALPPAEAKELAAALKRASGADHGTADISHTWRIPGCLNWPNRKKLERGRGADPVPVVVAKPWLGELTRVDDLKSALAAWAKPKSEIAKVEIGDLPLVDSVEVSTTAAAKLAANDVGDRSAHAARVVEQLAFDGHSPEAACALFLAASGNWLERYPTEDRARADFERLWAKPAAQGHLKAQKVGSDMAAKLVKKLEAPANDNVPGAPLMGVQLLSYDEFKEQAHSTADAIIKGLVRTGTLIAVGGRPGAGKTALMLAIADALDKGEPFLGRGTRHTTVAYIAAEDGGDVANRLEAIGNAAIKIVKSPEGFPLTNPPKARAIAMEVVRQARLLDPDRHVMLVVDTLRAALGGESVLEDRVTSPALNALREVAEAEGVVIAVLNHTNRENNKATKGETLEAVTALELVLLDGDGGWHTVYVGKNRSGPGHRNIGKVKYTSVQIGDVTAAIIEEMVADDTMADEPKERKTPDNARLLEGIIKTAMMDSNDYLNPFGVEGPRVNVVAVADIREKFYARKQGLADSKLKAFNRALEYWLKREWVVRGDFGAEGVIWYARAGGEKPDI